MTSSLVGSEMCIRDRALLSPGKIASTARARWLRWIFLLKAVAGSRCRGPVSYTHLTLPTICSV
eukprot:10536917-Prorocentrum_lima.AAC.1